MTPHRSGLVFSVVCALVGLLVGAPSATAQAPLISGFGGTVDYGSECLSPNDDGSSAQIDVSSAFPNGLLFFGTVHTNAYINTNGNITFSGSVPTYTPNAFPVANQPMIAPYWGDVDIRYTGGSCVGSVGLTCNPCTPCHNPTENGVWWYLEPGRMVVTWDRVGYYNCHIDKRMSFQLILTEAGCGGSGDFDVEFRYNLCGWETGDMSGGSGGFGGTEAQAGFDAGNLTDFVAIPGSLDAGIAAALCTGSNIGTPGVWQFQIRSGAVVCPDAGQPCDTGLLGVCASGRTNCVGTGTECVQDVASSPEVCDAQDNDCDGEIDETDGDPLCSGTELCVGGFCVNHCNESFCGQGLVCDASSGLCVEQACVGVTCPDGERCVGGACVEACEGVVCPQGQVCRFGRCLDLCENFPCDDCSVCADGLCIPDCNYEPCTAGETCDASGYCIPDACVGADCAAGSHCDNGSCVDDCTGVVCPYGQMCEAGECIPIPPQNDAAVPWPDGGPGVDSSLHPGDATVGPDAASTPEDPGGTHGCICRSDAGHGNSFPAGELGLGLLIALFIRRRRR